MADGGRLRWRRGVRRLMFLTVRSLLRVVGFARAGAAGNVVGDLQFRLGGRSRRRMEAEMALALRRPADDSAVPPMLREGIASHRRGFESWRSHRRHDEALLLARSSDGLGSARSAGGGRARSCGRAHGQCALLPLRLAGSTAGSSSYNDRA